MRLRTTAAVLLAGGLVFASAAPASADTTTEVITGEYIELVSTADPEAMGSMLPGETVDWTVSVSADAPEPGVIDVALAGTGDLALSVAVESCAEPWIAGECNASQEMLRAAGEVVLDGSGEHLLQFDAAEARHLMLHVALADASAEPAGATELRVHANGFGEDVDTSPPDDDLPETGFRISGVLLTMAGAIIIGVFGAKLLSRKSDAQVKS